MGVKSIIEDDMTGKKAEVDVTAGERQGLVVATRPLKVFENTIRFFENPTYGNAMNQNAAFGGTPVYFHNGTDDAYKTFSEPTGTKAVEDSTDQAQAGTKSIEWDNGNVGDIVQIAEPGTDITVASYNAFTMWIYVDADWGAGDSIVFQGYDDGTGYVGNEVALEAYFDWDVHDTWHYISIPLEDMGLTSGTIDAVRFEIDARSGAKSPKFYLDGITLQETGANIEFSLEPEKEETLYITEIHLAFADAVSADNADSTMYQLSYDKVLDVTLANGFLYERFQQGDFAHPVFSSNTKGLGDLLKLPGWTIHSTLSDGTNTFVCLTQTLPVPLILKSTEKDILKITIRDDMTGLLLFTSSVAGYIENGN